MNKTRRFEISHFRRLFFCLISVFLLASCANKSPQERGNVASRIADGFGFSKYTYLTSAFKIRGYLKKSEPNAQLVVYIEGDGVAWIDRNTVSPNPTPTDPVGFKLASLDRSPNVLYLARPCQYVNLKNSANCNPIYWTHRRYSEEVINSYNEILSNLSSSLSPEGYHLVGYSGGGAIAAILAASRKDILTLRTVAGNLDHDAVNEFHSVTPLVGSINPITYARNTSKVPQAHFFGGEDDIIQPQISEKFIAAQGPNNCAERVAVKDASHSEGWLEFWNVNALIRPTC